MMGIINAYRDGEISKAQTLHALCNELGEREDTLKTEERAIKEIRKVIEEIIQKEGTQEIKGFGRLSMVQPTTLAKWDSKMLDALVVELMQSSEPINPYEVAAKIAACKSESVKSGFLRIEREK